MLKPFVLSKMVNLVCLATCSRAMGDSSSAVSHFEESIEFLMKLPMDDLEV